MEILFDFEIAEKQGYMKQKDRTVEAKLIIDKIRKFVTERLRVLENECNKYPAGVSVIRFQSSDVEAITHHNYPDDVVSKLRSCLTQQDIDYILNNLWEELHPGTLPPTN